MLLLPECPLPPDHPDGACDPKGTGKINLDGPVAITGLLDLTASIDRVSTQFDKTDTTLANITGLSVPVLASGKYRFRVVLYTTSNVAGGVKFAISGTATATSIIYEAVVTDGGAILAQTRATAMDTTVGAVTAVTAALCIIEGSIVVNAAGTLTVQFAENVATATSSVLINSNFEVIGSN